MSTNETIKHVGQLRWLAQFYDDPSIDGIALYVEQLQAERNDAINALENYRAGGVHSCSSFCTRPMCVLKRELAETRGYLDNIRKLVAEQAADDGLWFVVENITEKYLQQELRRLHEVIEAEE